MRKFVPGVGLLLASAILFAFGSPEDDGGFSYEGIRELVVEGETFDVEVQGTESQMTVLEVIDKPSDWRVLHSQSGDQLRVWVDREFSLFGQPHNGQLSFHVPGDIEVRISNTTADPITVYADDCWAYLVN